MRSDERLPAARVFKRGDLCTTCLGTRQRENMFTIAVGKKMEQIG